MNESLSSSSASRSRALSIPAAVRLACLSAPPPASAFALRASYSFNNASNDMSVSSNDSHVRGHDAIEVLPLVVPRYLRLDAAGLVGGAGVDAVCARRFRIPQIRP